MNGKKVKQLRRLVSEATADEKVPRVETQGWRRLKAEYTRRPKMSVQDVKHFIVGLAHSDMRRVFRSLPRDQQMEMIQSVMKEKSCSSSPG